MRRALACSLGLLTACVPDKPPPAAAEIPAERIAVAGHGAAFDAKMREIPIDTKTTAAMLRWMASRLDRAPAGDKTADFVKRVDAALAETRDPEEQNLLLAARVNRQLADTPDEKLRTLYAWRGRFLYERARSRLDQRARSQYQIDPRIIDLLRDARLIVRAADTDYMNECRAQAVPVPPDFALSGAVGWVNQGNLTTNMLRPGEAAGVWTWTDPARSGACVALPRGGGGFGTLTGIICQSATTGRACFWDNLTRDDPGRRIPVATETMVIRNLQDGRTLAEASPCTECHTGNNVYLLSPDVPTWAKLMRGVLSGPRPGTFTTIVEPQTDSPGGPRYTPIAHPSWVNPSLTLGCSGACHAALSPSMMRRWSGLAPAQRPTMAPACAGPSGYRGCYGTP